MKFALCETTLGWAAIGIEDGAICAVAMPASRRAAEDAIASWDAEGPADEEEAAPFIDLVQRAANGERIEIYRPLKADPREIRRQLAAQGKTMGKTRKTDQ